MSHYSEWPPRQPPRNAPLCCGEMAWHPQMDMFICTTCGRTRTGADVASARRQVRSRWQPYARPNWSTEEPTIATSTSAPAATRPPPKPEPEPEPEPEPVLSAEEVSSLRFRNLDLDEPSSKVEEDDAYPSEERFAQLEPYEDTGA